MLKLLKKLKELVFGEIKPVVETPVVENQVVAPKKKFKHKNKPQPKNS